MFARQGGGAYLAARAGSFVIGVGLSVYGNWFLRKMKGIGHEVVPTRRSRRFSGWRSRAMLAARGSAAACAVCFGDPNSPITKSAEKGVWFLLAVMVLVEVGFGIFFLSISGGAREDSAIRCRGPFSVS